MNDEIKQKAFVFLVLKLVQSVLVVFQCPWNYFFSLFYTLREFRRVFQEVFYIIGFKKCTKTEKGGDVGQKSAYVACKPL